MHIWPKTGAQGARNFFWHPVGGGGGLTSPSVCMLKMVRILWGVQICMQNREKKFIPHPPPPKSGSWNRTPSG